MISLAGTRDTFTIPEPEQGSMRRALDMVPVKIQKLVRHPVKRTARMRTAVQIAKYLPTLSYNKNILQLPVMRHRHAATVRVLQLIQPADNCSCCYFYQSFVKKPDSLKR
jgi:hypothetical protein